MSKREFPRQFVAVGEDLSTWERMEPYFDDLTERPIEKPEHLNSWLLDWSELASCIAEVGTDLYVQMTCQTDNDTRKSAYLNFVEHVDPKCKPRWDEVRRKLVECPIVSSLPKKRFAVLERSVRNDVELFREENVALQVEEAKLEQRYQEISGAMTANYDGREQTMQQLSCYLEGSDRKVRQEVWELANKRRLQDSERLDDVFDELFKLRHQMAKNAGFEDYRAYAFRIKERFDYTPDDCIAFHTAIEETCVPLLRTLHQERAEALGLETLKPWDLSVDVKGRSPLKPFESTRELIEKCGQVFDGIDPELAEQFRAMASDGKLDLDSRKGKAPGGYQSTYHESRQPFIFMNAVGMQRDVRTLLHEAGHAFHAIACREEPLIHYRSAPIEFSEVASMSMELLALEGLNVFFSGEELDRAKRAQLVGVVMLFPWVATIDAFQHWLYTHPEHTRDERKDYWLSLHDRFGGIEDFSGYEQALERLWHRQLHLFEAPFYYVEYGIAQLGALQVWRNSKADRGRSLAHYRQAMMLGGSRTLPELFEAAGVKFDFSSETLGPLMSAIQDELAVLGA